jgi:protein-disulfide isomerase
MKSFFRAGSKILIVLAAGLSAFFIARNLCAEERIVIYTPDEVHPDVAAFPCRGDSLAPVLVVDYFNFTCYYCDTLFQVLDSLQSEFKNGIRLYAKPFPMKGDEPGRLMALALLASGRQGRYWEMLHDLQGVAPAKGTKVSSKEMRRRILGIAEKNGFDKKSFMHDMQSKAVREKLDAIVSEAKHYGIKRVPTLLINGRFMEGLQPVAAYRPLVKQLLGNRP